MKQKHHTDSVAAMSALERRMIGAMRDIAAVRKHRVQLEMLDDLDASAAVKRLHLTANTAAAAEARNRLLDIVFVDVLDEQMRCAPNEHGEYVPVDVKPYSQPPDGNLRFSDNTAEDAVGKNG